MSTRNVSWG